MADPVAIPKSDPTQLPDSKLVRPKRGRWRKRCFYFLVLFGILGWFAPTIVAITELRNRVPKLLVPNFPGDIEFGETSLGWMSPIVIKNLVVKDEDGRALLEVGQFSTSETLWTLATRAGNIGTLTVVDPVIHVSLRDDGSNIESALTKLLSGPASATPSADVVVEIHNARIELEHAATNRRSTIDQVSLRMISTNGGVAELDLAIGNPPASGQEAN